MKKSLLALSAILISYSLGALMSGCSAGPPDEEKPAERGACKRAFLTTLEYWEDAYGRAPEKCQELDLEYRIELVKRQSDFGCTAGPGETITGCHVFSERLIQIWDAPDRDDIDMRDDAVHEWEHALGQCAFGDSDKHHLVGDRWIEYGPDTIEAQAVAFAPSGSCL